MKRAVAFSHDAIVSRKGGSFGCVLFRHYQIIGTCYNAFTSTNNPTAHGEIIAIRTACKHLQSFQLIDYEIFTSCEPCPVCLGAIYWAKPKAV